MAETVTVYKLDECGREVWQYPAKVLQRAETCVRLEAFFDRGPVDIGPAVFNPGDRFIETFYSDRWYNVFAVYRGNSRELQGWYCNICRPAELDHEVIRCEDLALDVWVSPDGDTHVMDEEEFSALPLPETDRRRAAAALQQVLRLGQEGNLPT